jgi:hypothetical protein
MGSLKSFLPLLRKKNLSSLFYLRKKGSPDLKRWLDFLNDIEGDLLNLFPMSIEEAKNNFKKIIKIVEIEPHNYCNRRCSYCGNSLFNRNNEVILINKDIYCSILKDLSNIDYNGQIRLARYSEPLAIEHIIDMVEEAKKYCPNSMTMIISNGDYLNESLLKKLKRKGLDRLHVSIHYPENIPWTLDFAKNLMEKFRLRLKLKVLRHSEDADNILESLEMNNITFSSNCINYKKLGFDRGGELNELTDETYIRDSPCIQVFHNFTIDYDGTVMPCCNLRGDDPNHIQHKIGKIELEKENIFTLFGSSIFGQWRRSLAGFGKKEGPCISCKQIIAPIDTSDKLKKIWRKQFEYLGSRNLTQ